MAPGGIVFAHFLSCQDPANSQNQTNPGCRHRYFPGHEFEMLGTTSLTTYVTNPILYPLGEPIFWWNRSRKPLSLVWKTTCNLSSSVELKFHGVLEVANRLTLKIFCIFLDHGCLQAQGVITAETRDAFNLPIYFRSKEEVEASVIKCGAFDFKYLQSLDDENLCPEDELMQMLQFPQSFATFFSAWMRALFGPIMEAHMGQHNTDEFFIRHQRHIAARATSLLSDPKAQQEYKIFSTGFLLVVLKRKEPST